MTVKAPLLNRDILTRVLLGEAVVMTVKLARLLCLFYGPNSPWQLQY